MPKLLSSEVFTPASYPRHTYVTRDEQHQERLLGEWLRSKGQIASIAGPSKAGKTVLVERIVGQGNLITVSGASIRTSPDQLWDRVLDWSAEPHSTTASVADLESDLDTRDHTANVGLSGSGVGHKRSHAHTAGTTETLAATVNRRGLPQVVSEFANGKFTILLDDFHYIPSTLQSDVAQQLKDAASRGLRICVASVPHRADNVVRALPELRGRVLAIDIDYWKRRELLEIAKLGCPLLGIHVDEVSLGMLAIEAAGSPQLMQAILLWLCNQVGVRETVEPARAVTLDDATRREVLWLTSFAIDFRSLAGALIAGPRVKPGERKIYTHRDDRKGDVYLTLMRAIAADPPRLTFSYADVQERLKNVVKDDAPDGASVVGALSRLSQIATQTAGPLGPSLEWDEQMQVLAIVDPYLLFYLRWSRFLERAAEGQDGDVR
jgi:hypothetical protein